MSIASPKRMSLVESLTILHAARHDENRRHDDGGGPGVAEAGKTSPRFRAGALEHGQATSLGLGFALAQPERKVVVCNGDGSMLMNLGSLVTITAQGPANLTVIVFDNGVYEVTGVQPTLGAASLRRDGVAIDFADVARACGFSPRGGLRTSGALGRKMSAASSTSRGRHSSTCG